ncbi:hypothetical protein COW36_24610 [bacterium (Candidatus Blackallbacteria) CG17_big_fil_post_rev_8_21_14_2_50_48_46]|uniref:Translocation and assembly module TamB C-terminal domain-containing protein n=1 Tax=bacterium (Candidatus Blackallbacteria) CG17_big_fil_post_rev_8_21_14_2_50_48_46 TaxID=2014261 RepID=A0A2M7FX92_9BACT|nr:MAG: hypothetical protein COW64_19550 [bacterium (Candidatus Blackallbacteria) CG18_big_fil_WC_8_21_14_2_50_49_26]PIW13851.1 MAG: hypothetical protein COW36_24610 [bacterium (Candidatus Blackallbacteria) CG17_big_fil_post_rev_8_21_14_2_50_48_46]PIW45077.1 MAG: hypothetical protein COW20_22240 [bacterium (Candidatus Blackallbacteria) CG13_big_fil_rev_8_21_14_2_50_49_14]
MPLEQVGYTEQELLSGQNTRFMKIKQNSLHYLQLLSKIFWGCLRAGVLLFMALFATLLILVQHPPPFLHRLIKEQAALQAQAQTGLPLNMERISVLKLRPWAQTLEIENLRIWGYQGASQPFLVLPRLRLELDLFNYLLHKPARNQLILSNPRFFILRDATGKLNVRPRLKPGKKEEEKGPRPFLPQFLLRIENSRVHYQDQDRHYPLKTALRFPLLKAEIKDQEHLDFSARLRSRLSDLDAQGQLNIWSGQTEIQAELTNPDLKPAAAYAVRVKDLKISQGAVALKLKAHWEDYQLKQLRYQGHLSVQALKARVPLYRLPLRVSTDTYFTQDLLQINALHLQSPQQDLSAQALLSHYRQPEKMQIEASLQIQNLDLGELSSSLIHPALQSFREMNPSGKLRSRLHVNGTLRNLRVQGEAEMPQANIRKIQIQHAKTRFSYGDNQVKIPHFEAQVFEGQIAAQAALQLGKNAQIQAELKARNVSLAPMKQAFALTLPQDYSPIGRVSLDARANGSLSSPHAKGRLTSSQLSFPGSQKLSSLQNIALNFDYSKALTLGSLQTQAADMGVLKMALRLKNMNEIEAWLESENLPLTTVNRWAPSPYFKQGTARLKGHLNGSLADIKKNWQTLSAQAQLETQNMRVSYPLNKTQPPLDQHLDQFKLDLDWQNGHAHFKELILAENESVLKGSGSASLSALQGQDWSHALQAHLDGKLNTLDFPFLKNYQVEQGQFEISLDVQGAPNRDFQISLKTQGHDLGLKGIRLASLGLEGKYAGKKLKIQQAHLQQGEDRVDLSGQVDLNAPSPVLNLQANSYRFDIQTLLTLLPPDIRAQLDNRKKNLETPPADKAPPLYALPMVRERILFKPVLGDSKLTELKPEELAIPMGELIEDHWNRWKFPPATLANRNENREEPLSLGESLAGKLSLDLQVTGSLANPQIAVQGLLQEAQVQDTQISESYLNAKYSNRHITLNKAYLQEAGGSILRASGEIDLDKELQLELQGEGISLKIADPFLKGKTRLEGGLNFFAVASGSLKQPEISAQMTIDKLLMNQLFFDRLDSISGYRNGYLKDLRVELKYGNQEIVAYGDFPVTDLNKPVDLTLSLQDDSFGLINLFTGALDWRKGKGAVLVRLVGSPRKPELEGTFRIDQATVYLPSLKETMNNIDIKGEVFTQKVHMDYLRGKLAGGNLEVKGTMDLLNLLPSFLNLEANGENLLIRYTMPGLLTTQTAVKEAKIKIKGLVSQPVISGKVSLGKNGETTFPFLKDRQDLPTSSEVKDESGTVKPPRFLFGGLKVEMPFEYGLHSPIFDIPIFSEKGLNLRHWGGQMTITGDIKAEKGTLYLFNNALKVDKMDVNFPKVRTAVGETVGINPDLKIETSFNVKGAEQAVKALMTGKLEDLKKNEMRFEFSNKQGLTDTQIFNQIFGGEAFTGLSQGDIAGVAAKFSDVFLRGLFNPLTSRLSELLGLEELSFGIVGQSVSGPVFSFNIRSNPFFLVEDLIEERLKQLNFLNRIRISGEGTLSDQAVYKLGGNYSVNENWALDYQFKSNEQLHKVTIKGSYSLPSVLEWLGYWRKRFNGELPAPTPSPEHDENS